MSAERFIVGQHVVLHAYGQWLPNDPRGSGTEFVRRGRLVDLGPRHLGRTHVQPTREELKGFYRRATPRLAFEPVWFDAAKRQVVADAFERVVNQRRYTVWACAVLSNHAHLCIRRHRDDAVTMWNHLADASREAISAFDDVADDHRVWSSRAYKVFLRTPDDVRRVVRYIEDNPSKEGLPPQRWSFVVPYDGWPFHRR